MIDLPGLARAQASLIDAGRVLDRANMVPATGGNFSMRLDERFMAVTVSGRHKGQLSGSDIMVTDFECVPLGSTLKPSDEALLHGQLYRLRPDVGAVLHTHCRAATALSCLVEGDELVLEGFELLKVFEGITTHEARLTIPVVDNSQDIPALAREVEPRLTQDDCHVYLIRGHGLYTWARDMTRCLYQVEALSALFDCELTVRRCR
ncbi:methylthioribulose 1-phosphate dehydratase [Larsenimonas salina]|uniref:methylthioribulose 1-phosphate dehydratase n=1 Tax=Larsenimonas salina TaxID=1295565 RepID=UPI00207345B0|nr:methylthioribulose 1-phosphate dehydratase [Larsenimonas salina]MCM5703966.1 methylthioribulose 1-phosphate dehydratase [Larsenimonas salina]